MEQFVQDLADLDQDRGSLEYSGVLQPPVRYMFSRLLLALGTGTGHSIWAQGVGHSV